MSLKHINIAFILFFGSCVASPQAHKSAESADGFDNYLITMDHIPVPNHGIINDIIRDDRGFIWFATARGLCKYDGYEVRVVAHESPYVASVNAVIRWNADSLLLATLEGLWLFDLASEQFSPFFYGREFSKYNISAIVEDSDGTIWIGTETHAMFSYNRRGKIVQHFTAANGLTGNNITSLLLDHNGVLWVGTAGGGLDAFNRSTLRCNPYRASASAKTPLPSDRVSAMSESDDHQLWIGTNRGVNVLDPTRTAMRQIELPSSSEHTVVSIAKDPGGKIWIGISELGLASYTNGMFAKFSHSTDGGRPLSGVRKLYFDPVESDRQSQLLWVGTRDGLYKVKLSANPFSNHIRHQNSLQLGRGALLSLSEDRGGILWVGLWGGGLEALRRQGSTYQRIAHFENTPAIPGSLPNNDVVGIIEDRNGNLWIGTGNGLAVMDPKRRFIMSYKHVNGDSTSLLSNQINALRQDQDGNLWICTDRGLSKLSGINQFADNTASWNERPYFQNYLHELSDAHPIGANQVTHVYQDRSSNIWATTFGRGLNKLEADGTFTRFMHAGDSAGSRENFIYYITGDDEGIFWLSTYVGLVSFDPRSGVFTGHMIEQLSGSHIFGIVPDAKGNVWLATRVGLARFNSKNNTFALYDEDDGIAFKEFFSDFFRNNQGRLIAGGIDGFTEFCPESVFTVSRPPEIAITSISVFDEAISPLQMIQKEIRLPYDRNFLSFSFAALDYSNPSQNRFAYRMASVDRDWVNAGTHNYVSYPNLEPGRYVFMVKGCNTDNVWNESGTSVSIIIMPPYWQTWWFRLLSVAMLGSAMYAAYRYRVRKLLEVERMRLRIADDLHDDVGSNLSTIAMVSRAVQRAPELSEVTKHKLAEIYDTAIGTSEGMKDIVWFIKPKNDRLDDLVLRMKDTASSLLANIEHDFLAPKDDRSLKISIDFKRNFFLAFKEILTNIVKHASATKVKIHVEQRDGMLETVIQDNGQGFDPVSVRGTRHGNGLDSLHNRARTINGLCEISSTPGSGTTIKFSGKL